MPQENPSVKFESVLEEELAQIAHGRQHRGLPPEIPDVEDPRRRAFHSNLVGLAFSGGGIRSATFNLGILQGLARWGVLPSIDYTSTVSGGGYIASWFHAWVKRAKHGFGDVYRDLNPDLHAANPAPEVQYLRRYSNYLSPSSGLLSADTWSMIATWLRNTLLNQIILFLSFAALLLMPRALAWLPDLAGNQHPTWGLCAVLMAIAVWMIGRNLPRPRKIASLAEIDTGGQGFVQVRIVLPILFTCALLSAWIHPVIASGSRQELLICCVGFGLGVFAFLALVSYVGDFAEGFGTDRALAAWAGIPALNLVAATVGAALLYVVGATLQDNSPPMTKWPTLVWGTPCFLLIFAAVVVTHIGLLGRNFTDDRREWWSRLGAWLIIYFLGWTAVFANSIYGPLLVLRIHAALENWWSTGLLAGWATTVIAGVMSGNSPRTGGDVEDKGPKIMDFVAKLAPPIFVGGVVLLEALALHLVIVKATAGSLSSSVDLIAAYEKNLGDLAPSYAALAMLLLAGLAALFGWRVDINEFSLHQFYRNRLMRCYLGASREKQRKPNPFTGFDGHDDLDMRDLRPDAGYTGPYPILNCTLNLVHGKNLAWQERKAASFIFTPLHCGFDADDWVRDHPGLGESEDEVRHGYCPTNVYAEGTVKLGQAAAISGAAATPNAGYHSSPAASFLMTIFDVRLGWWLGNPAHHAGWKFNAPHFGFKYLLFELLGLTDANRRFVYLSDGGHFENLALYELVRRRCRFIIACDSEQDPGFAFEGLGSAIRKCRNDFGVEIDINVDRLRPDPATGLSGAHCVVGHIIYPEKDDYGVRIKGRLVYIKASLNGDEPSDVGEYKCRDPEFPHTPTSDQWFDESQFESYRRLGVHTANSVFRNVAEDVIGLGKAKRPMRSADRDKFFRILAQQWYPPSRAVAAKFTEHSQALSALTERLRTDRNLRFLHVQVSPEWPTLMANAADPPRLDSWLPHTERELRAGFLFCNAVIQLMENVYLDLNLEEEHGHPDNRGWMNLFNHWVWASMFRVTWAVCAATYGARFQTFCQKRLQLELGKFEVRDGSEGELNFYERKRFQQIRETGDSILKLCLNVVNPADGHGIISYRFGFAVVDANGCLAYYRVQNHLRNIGLWSTIHPDVMKHVQGKVCAKLRTPPKMTL